MSEDLDRLIEVWHTMPENEYQELGAPDLASYLGWTKEQYFAYVDEGLNPKE